MLILVKCKERECHTENFIIRFSLSLGVSLDCAVEQNINIFYMSFELDVRDILTGVLYES